MMIVASPFRYTLDDLAGVAEKAELIDGRVVRLMPSGDIPSAVAFEVAVSLRDYAKSGNPGRAYADGVGFALPAPLESGRESFSPDASYYFGDGVRRKGFLLGAPAFAVEVRSEHDFGPAAERGMAAKRKDYFEAGTEIVWDFDPFAGEITSYSIDGAERHFARGDTADAEPVLPGWRVAVDDILA